MSDPTKLEALVKSAMQKAREVAESETVVGKPIVAPDGTMIVPVSKVSFGVASGGTDLGQDKNGFGGGSGAGITISPLAFVVIRNGETKLLQLTNNTPYQNAMVNVIPEVVDKIIDFVDKKTSVEDADTTEE
ncbi:MAG: sporulation protein YtfJ [Ruminococcus sp.]|nr:sporulation protein YtfJ [Ruminococcus sp.]MCR5142598.1 sporulation protein YtfJ [Ruminococcus sp.]